MMNGAAFAACLALLASGAAAADPAASARSSTTNHVCTAERSRSWAAGGNAGAGCRRAPVAVSTVCVAPPGRLGLE